MGRRTHLGRAESAVATAPTGRRAERHESYATRYGCITGIRQPVAV